MSETGFKIGLALGVAAAHGMIGKIETGFTFAETGFQDCETGFRGRGTFLIGSSELRTPKIVDCIDKEPTTTAAGRMSGMTANTVHADKPAETENAYLARFLAPVSRVGEMLQIDDALAGEMWAACLAVDAELTPREFVWLAKAKLKSWERLDDKHPGLKIKSSVNGALKGSMPNAVRGAWLTAARTAAPAELERDCDQARHILAADAGEYTPWWRAWARAMLAEAGEGEHEHGET